MIAVAVTLSALAGWRLAVMLVQEEGPWRVFERVRDAAGVPRTGQIVGFLPELLTCVWCVSVWTTTSMMILWWVEPWAVAVVAAWGAALVVERSVRP